MEVLLQLHNRGSILKNVPLDSLLRCALKDMDNEGTNGGSEGTYMDKTRPIWRK